MQVYNQTLSTIMDCDLRLKDDKNISVSPAKRSPILPKIPPSKNISLDFLLLS